MMEGNMIIKKRFTFIKDTVAPNLKTPIVFNNETISIGEVLDKLNELADENEQLRKENDMFSCELSVSANKEISRNCRIAELEEENEQLKQQNNQQYEQLSRLYNLIEQKEWRVLTDIIDNFKKSDEQLQKEWRTYGDVE